MAPIRNGRVSSAGSYYSLIRPGLPVPASAIRIHGLRPADLAQAPPAAVVGAELAARLEGQLVIAHAAWIEHAFLTRLLRLAGRDLPLPLLDTAALARALGCAPRTPPGREPSLELLARGLGLPCYSPHHALGDAMTTAAVFLALASRAEQAGRGTGQGPLSLRSLLALSGARLPRLRRVPRFWSRF